MDAVGGVNHENTPCRLGVFPGSTRRRRSTKHPTGICKSSSLSCRKECTRYLLPEGGRCVGRICAQTSELFRPFFYAQVPPTPAPGQAPGQAPLPSDAPARIQLTQRQYRHVVYAARQPAHCMGRWTSVIPRFGRKVGPPEAVPDGGSRRRRLLAQTRACCHGLPRGLPWVPVTPASPSSPAEAVQLCSVGRKVGPPEAVPDGGSRRRRLLAQTRACCHGLPRGLPRVPVTRASPSSAPAPRAIELVVGRALIRPAAGDKQPAWQMCIPVRRSGGGLAHASECARHVRTCHAQLWQRPAAAWTERRMRRHAGWCRKGVPADKSMDLSR